MRIEQSAIRDPKSAIIRDGGSFARAAREVLSMNEPPDNDPPGVPGFRTWRGVYLFVLGVFVFIVIALAIFSRVYA